eukprot:TRINITY_DN1091_c0_g1_i2.p2 TRINITY_DN1091_c0_g1~~TRINITY_DN1091_c0_g1_i2.p2  ORF type:complete len:345 (-),score=43.21 TRINITY_DN1091_c0_g1_i2:1314-2348(-)
MLISGATGFIGTHLIEKLYQEGVEPIALIREGSRVPTNPNIITRVANLADTASIVQCLDNVDTVVHLAALMQFYGDQQTKESMYQTNVLGTQNLINACTEAGVSKFIYVSTTAVYGPRDHQNPLDEDDQTDPIYYYSQTKLEAEGILKKSGIDYTILRITGTYGPNDNYAFHQVMTSVNFGLFFFAPMNSGLLTFTHVDDVIQGIWLSIHSDITNNIFNICADEPYTYEQWIDGYAVATGRMKPFIKIPIPIIYPIIKVVGPLLSKVYDSPFLFHPDSIAAMATHRNYDNTKAKKLLGFSPSVGNKEGIEMAVDYAFQNRVMNKYWLSPVLIILLIVSIVLYMI